jgi:predicted PurR-regulated permease PerM
VPDERPQRFFHLGLVLASAALLAAVALPIWKPLLLAAVAAATLLPWHDRLSARLRGRREVAAALLLVGLVMPVVFAVGWVASVAIHEARAGIDVVREVLFTSGPEGLLERLPRWIPESMREALRGLTTRTEEIGGYLAKRAPATAAAVGTALSAPAGIALSTVLWLFALYFFLLGGRRLVAWLASVSPNAEETAAVAAQLARASRTVIASLFVTALVQAAAATVGYVIARVPHAVFFGMLTFVAAFIPSVGTSIVALPMALLVLVAGHPWAALFLAVWALGVVGLIDNVIRPLLIKGGVQISAAVLFFALIGGLGMFGAVGLIVGPLAVSLFVTLATAPASGRRVAKCMRAALRYSSAAMVPERCAE